MSLRKAKFDDHWRHTFARVYPSRLESISFTNLLCLADDQIQIPSGICAIVGGNGVGKSALLAAISEVLSEPGSPRGVGHKTRLRNSVLEGVAKDRNGSKSILVREEAGGLRTIGPDRFESEFCWLEPSYLVNVTHKQVNEDANFPELLEPLSPSLLEGDELDTLAYLLGKKIDRCAIYEVTEYGGLDTFPYFVAESGGRSYGSESMGFGELSLLFILWKLRTLEKNAVLVLEEPEAHVSPRSQRALMDILAKSCDERGLSVILTTHSPAIIANLPEKNLVLVSKNGKGTFASTGVSKLQINDLLGATTLKRGLLLVEDHAAYLFTMALLSAVDFDLLLQVEILEAGSTGNLDSILRTLPKSNDGWLRVIGIYDGDMRNRMAGETFGLPHLFLPGDFAPEVILQVSLAACCDRAGALAAELHRPPEVVRLALEAVEGQDPHDWFTQLPRRLGCDRQALMGALVRIWVSTNKAPAAQFVEELRKTLE